MDVKLSDCKPQPWTNRITGASELRPTFLMRIVLVEGLLPKTDIFRIDASSTDILVTDKIAERVLRSGCTGIEFADPSNLRFDQRIIRYRTAVGAGERRIDFPQ
jgi:hypothetical protein